MNTYDWKISDANFAKDKGKVFSCFACGGGSSFGYKLSGYDVIGCNEIDPKMMIAYKANHKPKYSYECDIRDMISMDLPKELYELDILDGSFPCSSFSMAGSREKDWGKEKKFKEGQKKQTLDDLAFVFISLAKRLKPKVVVSENVKGLIQGKAIDYVKRIYEDLDDAGYYCRHYLLDASKMGVPQRRERVFFIAVRKDLASPILIKNGFFDYTFDLNLYFNEKEIPYKEIESNNEDGLIKIMPCVAKLWDKVPLGMEFKVVHPKNQMFNYYKTNPDSVLNTITSVVGKYCGAFNHRVMRSLSKSEVVKGSSFPSDYDFCGINPYYICGMSVPPLMMAKVSKEIYNQILSKI